MASPGLTPELSQLFQKVENGFKGTQLGNQRWYLLVIACLSTSPDPEAAAALIAQKRYPRRRLQTSRSHLAISKVEKPEDRDYSTTREGFQINDASHERGKDWFKKVYTRNAGDTIGMFDAHKDFAWTSMEITYGLFLSDRQVLDDVDTQLVVLPAIMSQNLPLETHWHIRGTRRIGVSKDDVQVIWDSVRDVAKFFGVELNKVPTVDAVEPDV
ncbi:hypothetical protein NXS19_006614 [Fusarium pseudograminearum]|nr:hypothetical protein NXS19_006614 [Fusarium pseudograminearum]